MGKLLFNTSAPANVLRNFVGNTVRRGKTIDITKALAPAAMTLGDATGVSSALKRVLPRLRVTMPGVGETMFMTVGQHRPKIMVAHPASLGAVASMLDLPAAIRPHPFVAVANLGDATDGTPFTFVDAADRAALFDTDEYIVLAENNTVIGRYPLGAEAQMLADYRSVFHLR